MIKIIVSILTVLALGSLVACNTVEGFGKDVSKLGDKIETSADKHK